MEYIIFFPIFLLRSQHVWHVLKICWLNNHQINDLLTWPWNFINDYLTIYSNKISIFGCVTLSLYGAFLWSVPWLHRWQVSSRKEYSREHIDKDLRNTGLVFACLPLLKSKHVGFWFVDWVIFSSAGLVAGSKLLVAFQLTARRWGECC